MGEIVKLNSYLREKDIEDAIKDSIVINFEVTERCNLSCKYCVFGELYEHSTSNRDKDLEIKLAHNLLDHLLEIINVENPINKKRVIYLGFYGGEPMIRMDTIKSIIDYVEKNNYEYLEFKYTITTNGTLLDKYIDYLVDKDFLLHISLDGDKNHNDFRVFKNGKESFSVIHSNINLLKNKYPEYFQEKVNFNSVIHKKNNRKDVKKYILNTYGKVPSMPSISVNGISECGLDQFDQVFIEDDNLVSSRDVVHYLKYDHHLIYSDYSDLFFVSNSNKLPTATCIPFSRRIHMCADGVILPCEKIGKEFSFGIVTNDKVELDYSVVCGIMNNLYQDVEKQCSSCEKQTTCKRCILQVAKRNQKVICPDFEKKKGNVSGKIETKIASNPNYIKNIMENYYEY